MSDPYSDVIRTVADAVADIPEGKLAVAVSGGGDSLALLHILSAIRDVKAVTVDHALRAESAAEAESVAGICADWSVDHAVLRWAHGELTGNIQAEARKARRDLITDWAISAGVTHVVTGHTLNDQAENFLLRLARGSGIAGLAAMRSDVAINGIHWRRPLLSTERETLRAYLRHQKIDWFEDPSNQNTDFGRVKMRQALVQLAEVGIDAKAIADTSQRLADANVALDWSVRRLAKAALQIRADGEVRINRKIFTEYPHEQQRRLLNEVILWMSGADYPPRYDTLAPFLTGEVSTLTVQGCLMRTDQDDFIIRREPGKTAGPGPVTTPLWDHRWQCFGDTDTDQYIAALGEEGLSQCPDWRESGSAREALLTTPTLWSGDNVIAAPLAGFDNGWQCKLKCDRDILQDVDLPR